MSGVIFILYNTVTDQATVSAPTVEGIEHALAYSDAYIPKRGPEWVICEFSTAIGINLLNFKMFPKSMIWDGVATYAKRKVAGNV